MHKVKKSFTFKRRLVVRYLVYILFRIIQKFLGKALKIIKNRKRFNCSVRTEFFYKNNFWNKRFSNYETGKKNSKLKSLDFPDCKKVAIIQPNKMKTQ